MYSLVLYPNIIRHTLSLLTKNDQIVLNRLLEKKILTLLHAAQYSAIIQNVEGVHVCIHSQQRTNEISKIGLHPPRDALNRKIIK